MRIRSGLDWQYLIKTALVHGVIPLLYANLQKFGVESVPEAALEQLRNYFRANVRHSFFLTSELLKLLEAFETHEIQAVPFKGPVLAGWVYGDVTLRQFTDLDIVVEKDNVFKAGQLITAQGYKASRELKSAAVDIDDDQVAFRLPQ